MVNVQFAYAEQFEIDLIMEHLKNNFPDYFDAVSKRKAKETQEYNETLKNKGEFFSWQTPKKILKGIDDTVFHDGGADAVTELCFPCNVFVG